MNGTLYIQLSKGGHQITKPKGVPCTLEAAHLPCDCRVAEWPYRSAARCGDEDRHHGTRNRCLRLQA